MSNDYLLHRSGELTTPLLFLVFNRPDITKRVFEAIRQARPSKLYVAADGQRPEKEGENAIVQEVRTIATNVDWPCEVKTLFRNENFGCKMAVSDAITWFFEYEEEGIILEDDCLPDPSFFPYCAELLKRYRDDTRIMAISGDNFQQEQPCTEYSYYFSRYIHVWGWATWRRAWQHYDRDLISWPKFNKMLGLKNLSGSDHVFVSYWESIFEACYAGKIDTWDYPWLFSIWSQGGLSIIPSCNLVRNIGFGEGATHTGEDNSMSSIPQKEIEFPLKHSSFVLRNIDADIYTDMHHYRFLNQPKSKPSLLKKIMLTIAKAIRKS